MQYQKRPLKSPVQKPLHQMIGCPLSSRGWASFSAMKGHSDRHLGGFLEGDLPLDWLHNVGYGVCGVCNRILSSRFRGRCPSCWPAFVESSPQPCSGRPISDDFPPLDQVLFSRIPFVLLSPLGPGIFGFAALMPPSRESLPIGTLGLGWIF